jgi:hypothetical protein
VFDLAIKVLILILLSFIRKMKLTSVILLLCLCLLNDALGATLPKIAKDEDEVVTEFTTLADTEEPMTEVLTTEETEDSGESKVGSYQGNFII